MMIMYLANAMLQSVPLLRSSTAIDSSKQHQILEPPADGLKTGKRSGTLDALDRFQQQIIDL